MIETTFYMRGLEEQARLDRLTGGDLAQNTYSLSFKLSVGDSVVLGGSEYRVEHVRILLEKSTFSTKVSQKIYLCI
jgi:hypothetical protein